MNKKELFGSATIGLQKLQLGICTTLTACAIIGAPSVAYAAGTLAGTDIENIATATYTTPGGPVSVDSNKVIIKVDELLDVTVASSDPGDIRTVPGATGNVLTFQITNTGNGPEAFTLTADVAKSGDDFDPTLQQIVLDTNSNGVYDPGVDTVYVAGTNDPLLAPDASIKAFILTNTPPTQTDGQRAEVGLLASAKTGTGSPGTTFVGQGEGGGNAVVGTTGADAEDSGFLVVQSATISVLKSATISDPFGGSRPVPGAVITYTIVASVSGTGNLSGVVISDPIPADTQYSPGTITYKINTAAATAQSDATDTDAGNFNGTQISVTAGTIPAGETRTVTFKVKIR